MAESQKVVSGKLGGKLYVCQPNATMYRLVKLGETFSLPYQWSLMAYELGSGTPSRLYVFSRSYCNAYNPSLTPNIFARESIFDSTSGILVNLKICERHVHRNYGIPGKRFWKPNQGATSPYVFKPCFKGEIARGSHIFLRTGNRSSFARWKVRIG